MRLSRALLCVLFAGLWSASGAASEPTWRTFATRYFNIYYQPSDSLNAIQAADILADELPVISRELNVALESPIGVFIAPTRSSFIKLTGGNVPHWGEAVADPAKQIIILKSPRWSRPSMNVRIILVHELVHILVQKRAGNASVPRWLNEGMAIYFSGETSHYGGKEVSRAQLTDQLIPLATIDQVLSFETLRAQLAYQESYLAVVYIADQYGESALPKLLQSLSEASDLNLAFQKTFGLSVLQFEREWHAYLKQKYHWSIFSEFESVLWIGATLLVFLAFWLIVRRNRRTVKKWEEEEQPSSSETPPEI